MNDEGGKEGNWKKAKVRRELPVGRLRGQRAWNMFGSLQLSWET